MRLLYDWASCYPVSYVCRWSSEVCPEQGSPLAELEIVDSHKASPNEAFSSSRKLQRLSNGQLIMIHLGLQHPVSDRSGPI
ncbi:hypothetical protein PpBr36_07323 [Pyricularia pennisetigena]|uniref:hypothetical protein n=1 Tax=Pyricularia pennisetigena TaxID=1578925 RepID=UPI00114E53F2|nr:hypothetical protein PpBr36_07323 [Pyricularia pennisetigena]TLS25317.1 hypothetical protein PpBr36_07323 [Pyricularia pennisetigena]